MADDSLGVYCDTVGVRGGTFLSDLKKVNPGQLKNGHLPEILSFIRKTKTPWKDVQKALAHPSDWSSVPDWFLRVTFSG